MNLTEKDLHFVADAAMRTLKGFDPAGEEVFQCEARNATLNAGLGHFGHCPPGIYRLGAPVPKGTVPFGLYFVPIIELPGHHEMDDHDRAGIGVHGGGSGLRDPFAPQQGWQLTEGCWRVQNEDLLRIVALIRPIQGAGGVCYLTVV